MDKIIILSNCPGDVFRAAKELELEIIFINSTIASWQSDLVDHFIEKDPYNYSSLIDSIRELACNHKINAVTTFDERAVPVAAKVARELGIKSNTYESAYASRNKFIMRSMFQKQHLNCPKFFKVQSIEETIEKASEIGYPVVIKPLFGFASQGVVRVNNVAELKHYFPLIREIVDSHNAFLDHDPYNHFLLVEEYIPGREVAVDAILCNNEVRFIGMLDKPIPLNGPTFEETMYVTPTCEKDPIKELIYKEVERGIRALGLETGPIHAEVRICNDRPYLIEIGARAIGGVCGRAYTYCLGENYYQIVLNNILNYNQEMFKKNDNKPAGVMMIPVPKAGTIKKILGVERAREVAGIEAVFILAKQGDIVHLFPKQGCYLGFILATGNSQSDVINILSESHRQLEFEME